MSDFKYRHDVLHCEDLPLDQLAKTFGTPTYIYSGSAIDSAFLTFQDAFAATEPLICFAVKANSNLSVLQRLARLGSGFDIVSGGELERVLRAGGDPSKIVFSGVGKTETEIRAALTAQIHCFNVESAEELDHINAVAKKMGQQAPISLRVNPDVNPETHPYIATGLKESKFGIPIEQALSLYQKAKALTGINIKGIDCHIGSQITQLEPYEAAMEALFDLVDQLLENGIELSHIDLGGGMSVCYLDEPPFPMSALADSIARKLHGRNLKLILEPGRYIVADAGILLAEVLYTKHNGDREFGIIDAAMNDLIRPALYGSTQKIMPVKAQTSSGERVDIVGPICETGDFLAKDYPLDVQAGALIALVSVGAYGMSMSSNYNTRGRAAEVLVDGDRSRLIRRRESVDDLLATETDYLHHDAAGEARDSQSGPKG